jgi:hypothetical protein
LFELTSFYAIDFSSEKDYSDLKSTLYSLKEIYIDEKIETLDDTDFFMVDEVVDEAVTYKTQIKQTNGLDYEETMHQEPSVEELCGLLKKSIRKGDVENSAKYAAELASFKINLDILCSHLHETEPDVVMPNEETDFSNHPDLNKIDLVFKNRNDKKCQFYMNASTTSILDLKKRVPLFVFVGLKIKLKLENNFLFYFKLDITRSSDSCGVSVHSSERLQYE